MDTDTPIRRTSSDLHFLLNFIMGSYLGPDVYSDNPRRSALQRAAERVPPYTSNNLGPSFLSISQLGSLYYYVLRNALPTLVLTPNSFYMYLKGKLPFSGSELAEYIWQFTYFFPLKLHEHKRYSASNEIIKGIVLIGNPITSYMKKDDLERFKYLTGMDDLKIDVKQCLFSTRVHKRGRRN